MRTWRRQPWCSNKVSFAFDEHVVLRDISFSVPQGSMRIVLGASGTGKPVVLRLILGLFRPDAGRIDELVCTLCGFCVECQVSGKRLWTCALSRRGLHAISMASAGA